MHFGFADVLRPVSQQGVCTRTVSSPTISARTDLSNTLASFRPCGSEGPGIRTRKLAGPHCTKKKNKTAGAALLGIAADAGLQLLYTVSSAAKIAGCAVYGGRPGGRMSTATTGSGIEPLRVYVTHALAYLNSYSLLSTARCRKSNSGSSPHLLTRQAANFPGTCVRRRNLRHSWQSVHTYRQRSASNNVRGLRQGDVCSTSGSNHRVLFGLLIPAGSLRVFFNLCQGRESRCLKEQGGGGEKGDASPCPSPHAWPAIG